MESVRATGGNLDLVYNDFYYNIPPDQMDTEDGFSKTKFRVHKVLIYDLYQQGVIRNVRRHYTILNDYGWVIKEEGN